MNQIPNAQFATVNLASDATTHGTLSRSITLDGNKTVGVLSFGPSNGESYTITAGTGGTLTFDNGGSAATAVLGAVGTQVIDSTVGLNLSSNLSIGVTNVADKLTVAGAMETPTSLIYLLKPGT